MRVATPLLGAAPALITRLLLAVLRPQPLLVFFSSLAILVELLSFHFGSLSPACVLVP